MPAARLPSAPSPASVDVAVVGAGAAGVAAARRLRAAGLAVVVIEARDRIGGRAVTVPIRGHPIDLGAHWLHAGSVNPLVKLGFWRREALRRAPQAGHLVLGGRIAPEADRMAYGRAFDRADQAFTRAARAPDDRPVAEALPPLGRWRGPVAASHALLSGRPLAEVSLKDFPSLEYGDNYFIRGGYGAYLGRLAAGLPIRLGCPARAIDWSGAGVRIDTASGVLDARAAIVTAPMMVLQAGAIRFDPPLPAAARDAIHGFRSGTYEHIVLHWPSAPFRGADRLAKLVGGCQGSFSLLTRIDGTAFHYLELDHRAALSLDGRDAQAAHRFARTLLRERFGARAIQDLSVVTATSWRTAPWSRGSWAVVPPGFHAIRDALRQPVGDRLWFAGEALSRPQWGTVGGAWDEGERAAEEITFRLGGSP